MTALHDAHEKLRRERDGLPPTVRDALDVVLGGVDQLRESLNIITREYGHVCEEFDICDHPACNSSYGAWAVADEALRAWEQREETT